MNLIEKVKNLDSIMFIFFFASKVLIAMGIGVLFAPYLKGVMWLLLLVGIVLSIIPAMTIMSMK